MTEVEPNFKSQVLRLLGAEGGYYPHDPPGKKRTPMSRIWRAIVAEVVGTAILTYMCIGSNIAARLPGLEKTPALPLDLGIIQGFTLVALIFVFAKFSGAHFNPAITTAFFVVKKFPFLRLILYILAQVGGATAGAAFARITFPSSAYGHFGVTKLENGEPIGKGFAMEVILTGFIALVAIGTSIDTKTDQSHIQLSPIPVGFTLIACVVTGAQFSGASLNPARSFGASAIEGNWSNHWIYWSATFVGTCIAAVFYRLVFVTAPIPEESKTPGENEPPGAPPHGF